MLLTSGWGVGYDRGMRIGEMKVPATPVMTAACATSMSIQPVPMRAWTRREVQAVYARLAQYKRNRLAGSW